jgi:hypothetical protein
MAVKLKIEKGGCNFRTDPGTIPVGFGLIWFSGFRGEDF